MHVPLSRISWWPDLVIVHQLQSADTAAGDTWQQYAGTGEWNRLRLHSGWGRYRRRRRRLEPVNSLHKCIKYSLPMECVSGKWEEGGAEVETLKYPSCLHCMCLNASLAALAADSLGFCLDFYISLAYAISASRATLCLLTQLKSCQPFASVKQQQRQIHLSYLSLSLSLARTQFIIKWSFSVEACAGMWPKDFDTRSRVWSLPSGRKKLRQNATATLLSA